MRPLRLYSTPACHLCEQAEELLRQSAALATAPACWERVDICQDDSLLARYGTRIPVLHDRVSNRELAWPFDLETLQNWLAPRLEPLAGRGLFSRSE